MTNPQAVLFAIQAGVRLYGASRKAYADSTRARALILPLPPSPGVGWDSADAWFRLDDVGSQVAARHARVGFLLTLGPASSTAEQRGELIEIYRALYAENVPGAANATRGDVREDELGALLTIRQWAEDEPCAPRTALQQVAGTLVNVAVDYFAQTPGAVSDADPRGRALLAFLTAIDDVDFADSAVRDIAGDLLLGVLQGVEAAPGIAGGGEFEQAFVGNLARSLAQSARAHLEGVPTTERRRGAATLQLLARSLLSAGAETVLSNPVRFMGVEPGAEEALVSRVGSSLAGLLLSEPEGIAFGRLLSADGVTVLAKAALAAVAEHPELVGADGDRLQALIVGLAQDLATVEGSFSPDLLPELARLVLEHTATNLDALWPTDSADPAQHLLLTAARSVLTALTAEPAPGHSLPRLTKLQLLDLLETVFAEVVDNPAWVVAAAGAEHPLLGRVVESVLAALGDGSGRRLSADGVVAALRSGLLAVADSIELLDVLPDGGEDAGRVALTAAIDAVLATLAGADVDPATRWRLARDTVLAGVIEASLELLSEHGADQPHLDALHEALDELADGELELELYEDRLDQLLAAA